jgi:hypothetical protein
MPGKAQFSDHTLKSWSTNVLARTSYGPVNLLWWGTPGCKEINLSIKALHRGGDAASHFPLWCGKDSPVAGLPRIIFLEVATKWIKLGASSSNGKILVQPHGSTTKSVFSQSSGRGQHSRSRRVKARTAVHIPLERLSRFTYPSAGPLLHIEYDKFVRDGQHVLLDMNGSGATQAHYTDNPGEWGGLASLREGASSHYFAFDPSENARALTDNNGNVTDTYVYTAFGDEKS